MIEANTLARMYSQIVQGKSKDESTLVVDDEHGTAWDAIAAEVETQRESGITFEVPFDDAGTVAEFDQMRMTDDDPWPPAAVAPAEQAGDADEDEQEPAAGQAEDEAEADDE